MHRHGLWIQRFLAASVARVGTATGTKVPACAAAATTFWEKTLGTLTALTATDCEWTQFDLGWMFTLFFVLLGSSAAIWGGWLEVAGPRKAGVYAALCWCGGLMISAIGVKTHQLWALDRLGRNRRHRTWTWLYFAGIYAHQMVSGPARHGNGHGDQPPVLQDLVSVRTSDEKEIKRFVQQFFSEKGWVREVGAFNAELSDRVLDDYASKLHSDLLKVTPKSKAEKKRPWDVSTLSSLNEGKLILVGRGEVGKTSLVRRLAKNEFRGDECPSSELLGQGAA